MLAIVRRGVPGGSECRSTHLEGRIVGQGQLCVGTEPRTAMSLRSRSATVNRSRFSSAVGVCSTSHPLSRQVLKLIFGADDEQLRFPRCLGGASSLSNERRRGAGDNRLRVHARQIDLIER